MRTVSMAISKPAISPILKPLSNVYASSSSCVISFLNQIKKGTVPPYGERNMYTILSALWSYNFLNFHKAPTEEHFLCLLEKQMTLRKGELPAAHSLVSKKNGRI